MAGEKKGQVEMPAIARYKLVNMTYTYTYIYIFIMYRPLLILIPFSHVCTCVCLPWPRRLGATGLSVPSYLVMQGFLAAIVFGVVEGLWQYMKFMKFLKVSCFLIRTYHFENMHGHCTYT